MVLGIDYIFWISLLGAIALWLSLTPGRKKQGKSDVSSVSKGDIQQLVDNAEDLEGFLEMRWLKITAEPDKVSEILNIIEVKKISVMYQFFLNDKTGNYDLFFRCRKNQLEDLKKSLEGFF